MEVRMYIALGALLIALGCVNGQSTLPDSRWGQAATVFGTTLLMHGGKTDPTSLYSYTSAPNTPQVMALDFSSAFSLDSPPWQTLNATSSPALAFHTITAYSTSELLFFGGDPGPSYPLSTRNDSAGTMWLNGPQATWTTHPEDWAGEPLRREFSSAASWAGKVIITGGQKVDGSGVAFKDPYAFDSGSAAFSPLSSDNGPPDLVGHVSLTLFNGTMLVLGGYSNSLSQLMPLSTIYSYNILTNSWSSFNTTGNTLPSGRRNFAATMIGNSQFLIHGGANADFESGTADGFIFDVNALTWTDVPALMGDGGVGTRWDHTAFAVGPQVFFTYGYTPTGPAPNGLLLFDTTTSQFVSQFTPGTPPSSVNINSPIISPQSNNGGGGGGGGGNPNSGGNNGNSGSDQGSTPSNGNPSTGSSTPIPDNNTSHSSTPVVIGGLFGGLAAAAVVVVVVIFYRRRRRVHRRGWSGATEESEKAVMVGGFQPVPQSRTYGLMTKMLHIQPRPQYSQAPRRERFDILAEEDNTEYEYGAMGNRPRVNRKGTSGSGSTYFSGARWSTLGGAPGAIGNLVNASVGSFRSAFGLGTMQNLAPTPSREGKNDAGYLGVGVSSRNVATPPTAWRRGSSYTSNYPGDSYTPREREDPFGDEHGVRRSEYGVEEEYQKAMMLQHEMLRRASSSGADDYSALVLNRRTDESGTPVGERPPSLILNRKASDGPPVGGSTHHDLGEYIRGGIPLEPVVSISDPSISHAHSEDIHGRSDDHEHSMNTHNTSVRTPADERYAARVYSPNSFHHHQQLQRNTSAGSRIGASLTRGMSVLSSLFGGGHDGYAAAGRGGPSRRRGSYSKGAGGALLGGGGLLSGGGYDDDLRDPNPPPPALGAGLIRIEEGGTEPGSRQGSGVNENDPNPSSSTIPSHHKAYPSLVLRPLHEKSLSSLRTANSEALERLGTGNWDVVQRLGTGSSRNTDATRTTDDSGYTNLGDDQEMGWRDVVSPKTAGIGAIVESPVDLDARDSSRETFWEGAPGPTRRTTRSGQPLTVPLPLSPTTPAAAPITGVLSGPRPIPPPKRVTQNLAQRIEALGMAREAPLPLQQQQPMSPTRSTPGELSRKNTGGMYGLAPKPTLFVANPGERGPSGSG